MYLFPEGFLTDSQISSTSSGQNGDPPAKELVAWEAEDDENFDLEASDDLSGENGWNAEEMFKRNEAQYGVTSTYKANLEGYTMQLTADKDSDEYK